MKNITVGELIHMLKKYREDEKLYFYYGDDDCAVMIEIDSIKVENTPHADCKGVVVDFIEDER